MDDLEAALLMMEPGTDIFETVKKSLRQRRHWKNLPRGVNADADRRPCSLAGCDSVAYRGFYCAKHTIRPFKYGVSKKIDIPLYPTWLLMNDRCYNPSSRAYKHYGGRGIQVCQEWRISFDAFYQHMHPKPSPWFSLDRIDNDGNYEPGNVRWSAQKEQLLNRRPPEQWSQVKRRYGPRPKDAPDTRGNRSDQIK